jgi:diguanylate cyclase (GGDEF)-like protein
LWRTTLLVWLLLSLIGGLMVQALHGYQQDEERHEAQLEANRYAHRLQERLNEAFSATFALAAVVREGRGKVGNFEGLAAEMLPLYPGVSALQLLPDGIIRHIYPLKGHEAALGHNVLQDDKRNREALEAMHTRQLVMAGPFSLVQGGSAVIGRFPVFLPRDKPGPAGEADRFWGFTNALIAIPDLLNAAQLQTLPGEGYHYQLWRELPDGQRQVFASSGQPVLPEPVNFAFSVPNGRWVLALAPLQGWRGAEMLLWQELAVLLITLLIAAAYYYSARYTHRLRQAAEERARELAQANVRLQQEIVAKQQAKAAADIARDLIERAHREWVEAFDAVQVLIFLHDNDFRIMRANRAYLDKAGISLADAQGKHYWEVFPRIGRPLPGCREGEEMEAEGAIRQDVVLPNGEVYVSHAYRVRDGARPYAIHILENVTEYRAMVEEIRRMAHHDMLTGLPNRILFDDRCAQAIHFAQRHEKQVALLLLDLDRFKPVNDTYGHEVGDHLLQEVARRLQATLRRRTDTIARLGGDEFVALLPNVRDDQEAEKVATNMIASLDQPFVIDGHPLHIGVSIGIALYPRHGETITDLERAADQAMYRVKSHGRCGYQLA